ncbi:MADS-box transcription factor family protein [Striga asiatica]|uniref:MADS-box transcription factor family protein n=1 Tax=Striga asiatica TaxID=4170 RepID=A0A5A7QAQ7_STRAF|nr:MADS-box transcription factor family protein [Striga asiatica]
MAKKPSMGRQKIKIEKIEVKNHLQVTFSKRRSGLFKKASELCTLCGVEIAIIVFSPAGKVFSFGHPNVESIVDRFLARGPAHIPNGPGLGPFHLVEAHRNASVRELNMQLGQILNELEAERKRGEELDGMRKTGQSHYWWEGPIDKLGLDELQQLRDAMEELKRNVAGQAARIAAGPPGPIYGPSGVFDQYESKPGQGVVGPGIGGPGGSGFGYCHGFF